MSHAPFAPSSAKRWIHCTGAFGLALQLPEPPESAWSAEGTRLHAVAADLLQADESLLSDTAHAPEDRRFLKPYLAYVGVLARKADMFHVEHTLRLPAMGELLYGTPDFVAVTGDTLEVVDLKTGSGLLVNPEDNEQLMAYAGLTLAALSEEDRARISKVRLTIVQPPDEAQPVKTWDTTQDAVAAFMRTLKEAIRAALAGSRDYQAGEWCRFCKAQAICPRLRGVAMTAPVSGGALHVVEDLPGWLDRADLLQQWLDSVREFAHKYVSSGHTLPGWELKPKRATRSWDDEDAVLAIARRRKLKIWQDKLLSPAMAEKAHPNMPEELREHIVSVSSGTNLVRSKGDAPKPVEVAVEPMDKLIANMELLKFRR